jgi:lipoic acid synthetase/lipoate-protein ligase A
MVQLVLHKMGIEATSTTHNDIMIGDRKVCGTAFYQLPGRSIVHSTMLYDTNMQHMLNAITPGPEKLEKKGIQSVRQRITLLKDYTTLSLGEIKTLIRQTLCDGEVVLTADQIKAIEQIESLKYNNLWQ